LGVATFQGKEQRVQRVERVWCTMAPSTVVPINYYLPLPAPRVRPLLVVIVCLLLWLFRESYSFYKSETNKYMSLLTLSLLPDFLTLSLLPDFFFFLFLIR